MLIGTIAGVILRPGQISPIGIQGKLPTLSDHDHHLYIRDDSGGLLVRYFEPVGKAIDAARIGHDFAFQLLP